MERSFGSLESWIPKRPDDMQPDAGLLGGLAHALECLYRFRPRQMRERAIAGSADRFERTGDGARAPAMNDQTGWKKTHLMIKSN